MKKFWYIFIAAVIMSLTAIPVFADAERVVTLGEDLTDKEQRMMLRYFGVDDDARIIYVNNDEERAFLGDYIPLSVIGSRTLSCAYVRPTNSGGIQVKTANLTWVTSNMIASALSTSGVRNCEVIAACPKPVSGTGALTGVLKAFEDASSTKLDNSKKEIAAREIATVSNVAENIGQAEATKIINDIKVEIIENEISEDEYARIEDIVDSAIDNVITEVEDARDELVSISEEQRDELIALAEELAAQKYDYETMKETLNRIENNVSVQPDINVNVNINNENNAVQTENNNVEQNVEQNVENSTDTREETAETSSETSEAQLDEDSILLYTNDDVFGEGTVFDATTEEAETWTDTAAPEEEEFTPPGEGPEWMNETEWETFDTEETGETPQIKDDGMETEEVTDTESFESVESVETEDSLDNAESIPDEEISTEPLEMTQEETIGLDKTVTPFGITIRTEAPVDGGTVILHTPDGDKEYVITKNNMYTEKTGELYSTYVFLENMPEFDSVKIEFGDLMDKQETERVLKDVTIEKIPETPYSYTINAAGNGFEAEGAELFDNGDGTYGLFFDGPGTAKVTTQEGDEEITFIVAACTEDVPTEEAF